MGLRTGLSINAGIGINSGAGLTPIPTPIDLLGAGVHIWLTAKRGVLNAGGTPCADGEAVATWTNYGNASGSNATEATNQPDYRAAVTTVGNRPGVDFAGATDKLAGTLTGTASGDSWVLWMVVSVDAVNNRAIFDMSDTTATNRGITIFYSVTPLLTARWGNAAGNNASTGTPAGAGTARLVTLVGSTTSRTIYENSVALSGGTNPETTSRAIAAGANYRIGMLFGDVFPLDGKVHEVVLWRGTPTAAQLTQMAARSIAEWGV